MNAATFDTRFPTLETKLRSIAGKYANDSFDAEDIFQHVCEKILTGADDLATDTQIFHLANWRALDFVKSAKVYTTYVMGESDLPGTPDTDEEADPFEYYVSESESVSISGPEAELIHDEEISGIIAAIKLLSTKHQQIVKLLAGGHNQKEIATTLHVSEPRITQQIKSIQIKLTELNISL